jgi:DHA1 family tetracycline resistance protein-like MFS transporter
VSPALLVSVLRHPVVGRTILLSFVTTLAFAMMEGTFALFEEHVHGMDAQGVGRMLGVAGLTMVLIQGGLIGRLVKRFGEGALLRAGVPALGLSMVCLAFARPGPELIGAMIFLAIAHGITQPSLHSLMSQRAPESEQGLVLGTNQSLSALARVLGPTAGGLLYVVASPAAFYGAAVVLGLATVVAFRATSDGVGAAAQVTEAAGS